MKERYELHNATTIFNPRDLQVKYRAFQKKLHHDFKPSPSNMKNNWENSSYDRKLMSGVYSDRKHARS